MGIFYNLSPILDDKNNNFIFHNGEKDLRVLHFHNQRQIRITFAIVFTP